MKQRIQHKKANCKDSSGGAMFTAGAAAVGLFALAKIFS
jgi:hypothetical protein